MLAKQRRFDWFWAVFRKEPLNECLCAFRPSLLARIVKISFRAIFAETASTRKQQESFG
jgi:hypothetical protein